MFSLFDSLNSFNTFSVQPIFSYRMTKHKKDARTLRVNKSRLISSDHRHYLMGWTAYTSGSYMFTYELLLNIKCLLTLQ